jgi:penicillin-binding protein 1A
MKLISRFTPQIIYIVTLFSIVFAMGFIALYLAVGPSLPEVESIRKIRLQTPMRVYSNDNQLIAEFGDTKRIPITLDQVPKNFINALLSTEDQRFYQHSGVDLPGVIRAFVNLATTGSKSQGASTITMLVARNYYLTRVKRFSRKITEMFLAWKIESELSKDEILELFLNKIHFSHRAYGLGAASQIYYGTTLNNLSLAKLATLAGIPKGESIYNPISNPEKALERRTHVLGRMLDENHITRQQYDEANAEPIETKRHGADIDVEAPYLAEMVRSEILERYGKEVAYNNGLNIYTTLNPKLQKYADDAVKKGLEEYDQRHGYRGPEQHFDLTETTTEEQLDLWVHSAQEVAGLEPALVLDINDDENIATVQLQAGTKVTLLLKDFKWATHYVDENHQGKAIKAISQVIEIGDLIRVSSEIVTANNEKYKQYKLAQLPDATAGFVSLNPNNGAIEALVGGYDYYYKKFNTVTQANRQLGSNIKPFVYSAAFEKGFTPASIINDMPLVEEDITAEDIWRPKNDGDRYGGPTRLRVGLRHSKNTVSIRLIRDIGPGYTKDYLTNVGFPADKMQPYLSLALGSASFTPLEVVTGYAVLANGGYKVAPWFIERIEDSNGRIIQQHIPIQVCTECEEIIAQRQLTQVTADSGDVAELSAESESNNLASAFTNQPIMPVPEELVAPRVIDKRNLFLVDNILKDVIHRGTARPTLTRTRSELLKRNDLAGKTGTTNDAKDAWFSGYNINHVATAWVGFDDHSRKLGIREFGGRAALPIWQKFMEKAVAGTPQKNHPRPEGIVTVRIDALTGLLATSQTQKAIFEVFRSENAPTTYAEETIEDPFNQHDETVDDDSLF